MNSNRRLIIVPIFHSKEDQGSLGSNIPDNNEHEKNVAFFWEQTSKTVLGLPVDFSKLYVYQDGLPNIDPVIVNKCMGEGKSPNYELLRRLQDKGAQIIGTEDPTLLKEEYGYIYAIVNADTLAAKVIAGWEYEDNCSRLLKNRDTKIAERIKDTLPDRGIGILFIGKEHSVGPLLEGEMCVCPLEGFMSSPPEILTNIFNHGKERE